MAFSFIKLISSSDTLTKREVAILKICPPAIITSAEEIIAEYDAILGQWEGENFYNHLSYIKNQEEGSKSSWVWFYINTNIPSTSLVNFGYFIIHGILS